MSDEDAKARQEEAPPSQEWAKTSGKAVDIGGKAVDGLIDAKDALKVKYDAAVRFVARVLGPSVENLGAMAADITAYWRFSNLARIAKKCEAIQAERVIDVQLAVPIPPRLGVPLLSRASEENGLLRVRADGLVPSALRGCHRQ